VNAMLNGPQVTTTVSAPPPVRPDRLAVPDSIGEAALLQRLQGKDHAAFAVLVRRHAGRMLAVAERLLGNEDEAQDAVQQAFISAFHSLHQFAGNAQLGTWLHRIVVNVALMKLRTRKRRPETVSIDEFLPTFEVDGHRRNPKPAWTASSQEILEKRELRDMIHRKIAQLPEEYRTVLMLRDIEELDTSETSEFLGITPGAVKTRLHRARMALRELLEMELS
jgi:RNA polymerase sigma-70 factor, ECF subfamily